MIYYELTINYNGENETEKVLAKKLTIENGKIFIIETNDNDFWIEFSELVKTIEKDTNYYYFNEETDEFEETDIF